MLHECNPIHQRRFAARGAPPDSPLLASLSIASGVMNTPQALEYTEGERIHQEALHAQANHRPQTGNARIV